MLGRLRELQIPILIGCGIFNLLLCLFILVIHFQSIKKKFALIKIQLSIATYMITDALSFLHDGDISKVGILITRIANFLIFTSLLLSIFFLCEYVTSLFMESGKFKKLPRRLLIGFITPCIGIILIVIQLFTGWYYYFDEFNIYHRGSFFWLGFIIPFIDVNLLFSFVIQHRHIIKKRLLWAVSIFSILPIVAAVVQLFLYGFPLIDIASWLASVVLFWFALGEQNDELGKAASTELATGLPNTYGFIYEVDRIALHQDITEYNGFYFDIIRMKNINTKYGRQKGDEIIVEYAKKIKSSIERDEILGRLGGNYFVALIKKTNSDKFLELIQDVPVDFMVENKKETVHIAAIAGGYEIKRKRGFCSAQLIGHTATAITYAKNVAHKNVVFLDAELEKELTKISVLEDQAKHGIENNEFEAFYQPKVDIRGKVLCGAEALVRWRKDGKLIAPFEFIQIMENNGSICDLDFYVLEKVCKDIRSWIDQGIKPVKTSINFSRRNLGNPILAEAISKVVEKYNVPKDLIQIEVTETIDEYPMSYLVGVVEALQRYGLTVAIDDFGTGSSSIRLLKEVKFDVLKIDKAFIDYSNDKEKKLLQNIISMAQDIGIDVIAEGVEEKNKLEQLKEMNCFIIQGYVFDKPLEKTEFEKRLQHIYSNY